MTTQNKLQKLEGFKRMINLTLVLLCLLLETAVFTYHWYFNFRLDIIEGRNQPFWIKGHMLEVAVYLVILILFSNMYGGMRLGYMKNAELIFSQIFATLMADILIYASSYFQSQILCCHAGRTVCCGILVRKYRKFLLPKHIPATEAPAHLWRQGSQRGEKKV